MILFLEMTTKCNAKCIFCKNPLLKDKKILESKYLNNLINIIRKARLVDISGYGEVTTHPEFVDILRFFKNIDKDVRIVTNGLNLKRYYDEILNSSISDLIISLNTLNPELRKYLMGIKKDGIKDIIGTIEKLLNNGFKGSINLSFIITKLNFDEIKDFIELGKILDVHIACLGLTPTLQHIYSEEIILENTLENIRKLEMYKCFAKEKNVSFFLFDLNTQFGTENRNINLSDSIKKCYWYNNYIFVGINGDVNVCCWNKISIGNIKDDNIEDILDGEIYKDLERCIKSGNLKYCSECRKDG